MIGLTAIANKVKLFFWALALFIISYILHLNLIIPAFLVSLYAYLRARRVDFKKYSLLDLAFLFLIIFDSGYFIINKNLPVFFIPFCAIPMLTTLLFNNLEISLLMTLAASASISSLSSSRFDLALLFLISGILSSILVKGARKRTTVILAGFIVGVAQAVSLIFIEYFWFGLPDRYLILFINAMISSIVVLGVLPVFEYLFRTLTNISLLELADFNHPLLQRMILEAPGTYHHSLLVGNLCESACREIGVNALLARIGAYYHDIGKLSKPEYFGENQMAVGTSKHDELSPEMSKLVIMNHVKEGVEIAKKYKLNPALIDFILQHHGTSLAYYFYHRALQNTGAEEEVKEEVFRYPGPKPNTKETAVVLLADSVEAASRALREPTPAKIKETVNQVINNKFIEGQLDECELTLKDLEKISAVFIRILGGIYHSRITYPEQVKGENSHKKFPKEGSRQSEKDKTNNS
jgi:hypothetical protein